jgi:hypothetical protein
MPKSHRRLPQQQGQVVGGGRPRYDVQRFPEISEEEWQARALKALGSSPKPLEASPAPTDREVQVDAESRSPNGMLERGSTDALEVPSASSDGAVHVHEESRSTNTTEQCAPGSNTAGPTSDAFSRSYPKQILPLQLLAHHIAVRSRLRCRSTPEPGEVGYDVAVYSSFCACMPR